MYQIGLDNVSQWPAVCWKQWTQAESASRSGLDWTRLRSKPYERLARPALVTVMTGTWCHGIVVHHSVLLCTSVVNVMFYCVCTVTAINCSAPTEGTAWFWIFRLHPYIDDCCEEGYVVYPPDSVMYVSYRCILCPWTITLSSAIDSMYPWLIIFEDAFIFA